MSIATEDGMEDSEFALTDEEKAELEAQEQTENDDSVEEVDQEFLDALLEGKKEPDQEQQQEGDAANTSSGEQQAQQQEEASRNTGADNDYDETAYQQHLANEAACNEWQEKLDQAVEAKNSVLDDIEALGKQLDDGEIGEGEYQAKKARLDDALNDHKQAIGQAQKGFNEAGQTLQSFVKQQQEIADQQWHSELQQFSANNPVYQQQRYAQRFDEVLHDLRTKQALDGLNFKQIIATVRHRVEMELGVPEKTTTQTQGNQQQKQQPKRQNVQIPPSMTQMSVAEVNSTGDEFAMLDRLDGLEYEAALEKLEKNNPDAYKRYMSN